MNRKWTIISAVAVLLMLAGIAWAVTRLYRDETPRQEASRTEYPLLRAVPADAAAVFCFDGSARARRVLADSTGLLQAFLAPENPALMAYLSKAGETRALVSLHNSGSLVPLVAAEVPSADSTLLAPYEALAVQAGLNTAYQDGLLLASRSETLLNSARRHLDDGVCILEAPGMPEAVAHVDGPAVAFLSSRQIPKLLQVWSTARVRRHTDFVRNQADWTAFSIQEVDDRHLVLEGVAACAGKAASYPAAFRGVRMPAATFPEVLPYYADYAVSIPVGDLDTYLEHHRVFQDGRGKLSSYDKQVKEKAGRAMSPEQWGQHFQLKEAVRAAYQWEGVSQEVLLVKTGKDIPAGRNASPGALATLLGGIFDVVDTLCVPVGGHWTALGSADAAGPFSDRKFLDYTLKERLSDAGLSVPAGLVVYGSVSDCPSLLSDLFAKIPAAALEKYVAGSAYTPALIGLDTGPDLPGIRVSLEKRALKGNKVQVLERDTTVVVPTGPFPVQNSATGKTNTFYQNAQLSLCLNDENGKGVWGVPFKKPLCGYVESIDYYANGKIQFLFAAGSGLYLIDRLGRFVGGFPVDLGKPVLLGPQAYDFTGAHGYTVMVLHKDNSLEMYNLHGQKPASWKGIRAPETVKALPELLEVKDKKYWVVRTSIRTLVYGFDGGDALTTEEGGKMIRPDSRITPNSRGGLTVDCYDGKTRDIKLN